MYRLSFILPLFVLHFVTNLTKGLPEQNGEILAIDTSTTYLRKKPSDSITLISDQVNCGCPTEMPTQMICLSPYPTAVPTQKPIDCVCSFQSSAPTLNPLAPTIMPNSLNPTSSPTYYYYSQSAFPTQQ